VVFLNSHDGTSAYLMFVLVCHHRRGEAWKQGVRGVNWHRAL